MRGVVEEAEAEANRVEERATKARSNLKTQKAELARIKAWAKSTVRKFEPQADEAAEPAPAPEEADEPLVGGPPAPRRRSMAEWRVDFRDYVYRFGKEGKSFTKRKVAAWFQVSEGKITDVILDAIDTGLIKEVGVEPRESFERGGRGRNLYAYNPEGKESGPIGSPAGTSVAGGGGPVAGANGGDWPKDKDIRDAIRPAVKAGATLTRQGNDHFRLSKEGKQSIVVSSTPSGGRHIKNLKAELQRFGYATS